MTIDELKVIITAQTQQFNSEINNVKRQINSLSQSTQKSTSKMSSAFSGIFKKFSAAAIVAGMIKVSKSAIDMASSLEEVQNVVDVSFGSMGEEINKFAKNAIKQFGMSELSAKQFASTFMAMGNGMGIVGKNGKNMSLNLTALTADMASFYDVSQDVAATALKSIYTGETESLKRFGIVMTEVNLQEFARQQGISKSISQMNQAQKTMLRYQYVMQATSYAQGDFARTSGSWANQIRTLKEQWSSFLGILGQGLIKVLTPLIQVLNTILGYLISIANLIAKAFGGSVIKSASSNISNVAAGVGDIGSNLDDATASAKKLQNQLMGFDEMNVMASQDTGSASGAAGGGGAGALGNVDINFDTAEEQVDSFADKIKNVANAVKDFLKPAFDSFITGFNLDNVKKQAESLWDTLKTGSENLLKQLDFSNYQPAIEQLAGSLGTLLGTVFSTTASNLQTVIGGFFAAFSEPIATFINNTIPTAISMISGFIDIITQLVQSIENIFEEVFNGLQSIFNLIGTALNDIQNTVNEWWNGNGEQIVTEIKETIKSIEGVILTIWHSVLEPIVDWIAENLTTLWNEHLSPFVEKVLQYVTQIWNGISTLWNEVLAPIFNWLIETFAPVIISIVKGIWKVISTINGGIIDVIKDIIKGLAGLIDFIAGVFTGDWERAWNGIKQFFESIWDSFKDIALATKEFIENHVQALIDFLTNIVQSAWDFIKGILSGIWNWCDENIIEPLTDLIDDCYNDIVRFSSNLWNNIKSIFSSVANWFKTHVTDPIARFFTNMGNTIKNIWNGIWNAIKKVINSIIGGINGMIRGVCSGVNFVIRALNKIHFDIPSWIPGLGGKSFGFNIGQISAPQIPMLANGGILTKPTLAIAGENGAEGVFPLTGANADAWMDNLVSKFINRMYSQNGNTHIIMQVDGKTFAETCIDNINALTRQNHRLGLNLV